LRAESGADPAVRHAAMEGYPLVRWSDREHAYAAVSDISPPELDAFVAAFRQAVARERGGAGDEKK
jgi:anti-sigma factor RsiW